MAWIRSQKLTDDALQSGKDILIDVGGVQRVGKSLYAAYEPNDHFLGSFFTKEAALVEFDRIEKWITDGAQGVYQVSGP